MNSPEQRDKEVVEFATEKDNSKILINDSNNKLNVSQGSDLQNPHDQNKDNKETADSGKSSSK